MDDMDEIRRTFLKFCPAATAACCSGDNYPKSLGGQTTWRALRLRAPHLLLVLLVIQPALLLVTCHEQQVFVSSSSGSNSDNYTLYNLTTNDQSVSSDNNRLNQNQSTPSTLISSSLPPSGSTSTASGASLNSSDQVRQQVTSDGTNDRDQQQLQQQVSELLPPPPAAYYYGSDMGPAASNMYESREGTDLTYSSLLNPVQERIQAVKSVLSTSQRSMLSSDQPEADLSELASSPQQQVAQHLSTSFQCTHKGRQYQSGQQVPIEDQPCLSCTCRRAILQCYLRVCPPVISVEAHKRMQAMATLGSGGVPQKCRTVKETNQCCPSIKCEPDLAESAATSNFTSNLNEALSSIGNGSADTNSIAASSLSSLLLEDSANRIGANLASNRSVEDSPAVISTTPLSTSQPTIAATPEQQQQQLPKLTVIKGAAGQRDSILLITSNPSSSALMQPHQTAAGRNQPQHRSNASLTTANLDQALAVDKSSYYNNLLESLLETVYSSAAQLNGVNLQGSCMINGSLYVEGSAVLPEGNAYCQYCYCIRQKIMCVKPKCHLIISGCTPKYSNEFACCPTSYTCASSPAEPSEPSRVQPNNRLSAKLSAAIESISRLSASDRSAQGLPALSQPRQVDRSLNSEFMLALMKSIEAATASNDTDAGHVKAGEPTSTSTTTATMATSTTSTTTPMPSRPEVRPHNAIVKEKEELARDNESDDTAEDDQDNNSGEADDEQQPAARDNSKKVANSTGAPAAAAAAANTSRSGDQSASVSDFLEPMNKLGPLVMSPASGCTENGRQYAIGEQIPTLERCKHCYCGIDGVKECKVMECSLRIAHNCKPVTPEGHCCPIRYECPSQVEPGRQAQETATAVAAVQPKFRARSETESVENSTEVDGSNPFKEASQCRSDSGLINDCSSSNATSLRTTRGDLDGPGGATPVVETTRLIDNLSDSRPSFSGAMNAFSIAQQPVANNRTTGGEQQQQQQQQQRILSEELNKFIMQIKGNQSANTAGTGYALLAGNASQHDSGSSSATQEMMINDQHARMVDYHSVQAAAGLQAHLMNNGLAAGVASIEPDLGGGSLHAHHMLNGAHRMEAPPTTGQIVPVDPVTGRFLASRVDYATSADSRQQQMGNLASNNLNASGQRDSRAANTNKFVINELLPAQNFSNGGPSSALFNESDQPDVISDDYVFEPDSSLSLSNGSRPFGPKSGPNNLIIGHKPSREMPQVRLVRNQHAPTLSLSQNGTERQQQQQQPQLMFNNYSAIANVQPPFNMTPLVVFDDSLGANMGPPGRPGAQNTTLVAISPGEEAGSTPSPPQPTTGTPIGLDADRAPETRGWMKQMSGLVKSFGRRLYGQQGTGYETIESAASADPLRPSHDQVAEQTARASKSGSTLFEQLMFQLLGNQAAKQTTADQQADAGNVAREEPPASKPALVMRPIKNELVKAENDFQAREISSVRPISPYEPTAIAVGASEVEIVTAAMPLDQELFSSSSSSSSTSSSAPASVSSPRPSEGDAKPQVRASSGSNSFAKRTDLNADELLLPPTEEHQQATEQSTGVIRNLLQNRANKQLAPADELAQQAAGLNLPTASFANKLQSKACYDAKTNRTYQANEIIAKEDPCITCICLLGEERCQTLVCPPKPAENCSEERRAGECCANYLCGNAAHPAQVDLRQLGPQLAAGSNLPRPMQLPPNLPSPSTMEVARMAPAPAQVQVIQDNHRPVSGRLMQRAMQSPESSGATGGVSQQFSLGSLTLPQGNQVLSAQVGNFVNRARNVQQEGDLFRQRHQLPQNPIKVSDLNNFLPSHLRFRPNSNGQPNVALLPNQLAQARVIFNSQAANQIRYPLVAPQPNRQQHQQPPGNQQQFTRNRNVLNNMATPAQAPRWQSLGADQQVPPNNQQPQVRPSVLLAAHQTQSTPANVVSLNDNQTRRSPVDESGHHLAASNMIAPGNWNWKSAGPSEQSSRPENTLPANVLIPRMSGLMPTNQVQQQISESQSNSSSSSSSSNWQPTNWLIKSENNPSSPPTSSKPTPLIGTPNGPFSPVQANIPDGPATSAIGQVDQTNTPLFASTNLIKLGDSNRLAAQSAPKQPADEPQRSPIDGSDRVVFQSQPTSVSSDDTGFQPIVAPAQRVNNILVSTSNGTRSSEIIPAVLETSKPSDDLFQTEPDAKRNEVAPQEQNVKSLAEDNRGEPPTSSSTSGDQQQPVTLSTTTEPSRLANDDNKPTTSYDVGNQVGTTSNIPVDQQQEGLKTGAAATASIAANTGDTDSVGDKQPEPAVGDGEPADFSSMFTVSECNIQGRIYQVGQEIEEVSSGCGKRCTCTSRGVECPNKC